MKNRRTINVEPTSPDGEKSEAADTMGRQGNPRKTEVKLGREIQARIGQQLRAVYDEVVNQGVPPHIADLVRRLSEQEDDGAA